MSGIPRLLLLGSLGLALQACSSGGGGTTTSSVFQLISVNVPDGAEWKINREILFTFGAPIDFASVSPNTIRIRTLAGEPGIGTFRARDERTVAWQPTCPTRDDLSDSGLRIGGVAYEIEVPGSDASPNSVRSRTGIALANTLRRGFRTPSGNVGSLAFLDPRPASGPVPILRPAGSTRAAASHLQIGGDPDRTVYFERGAGGTLELSEPDFELPLNLYSDPGSRVAFVIEFDQPVDPGAANLSSARLGLEFDAAAGVWKRIDARVTLTANCSETGARVLLEPIGVLPQGTRVRAVIREDFRDIAGQPGPRRQDDFARVRTRAAVFDFLDPASLSADAFQDAFDFGGAGQLSFEDDRALFEIPRAEWGGGRLRAAFDFDGDGGPGGDFDWVVRDRVLFDTTRAEIVGGPDGLPTTTQIARNGVVQVRDLIVEEDGVILVQGPNPVLILATGEVRIAGLIDLSGFAARKVINLNTGTQREPGGVGVAGGGRGGFGNPNIDRSSATGGNGDGPFGQPNQGGLGGSTAFNGTMGDDRRRPGGGGGGRFARDLGAQETPEGSIEAEAGSDGNPEARDAVSQVSPPRGGAAGAGPFVDANPDNDFFGVAPVVEGGVLVGLLRGELPSVWAGYGGGGGGNASELGFFPQVNWNQGIDEKGGGGGGGGGALRIRALGPIVFGANGRLVSNGGPGGTGESTMGENHVGGTGGGGSGGHLLLESATRVDFTDGGTNQGLPAADHLLAVGPQRIRGPTLPVDFRNMSNGGPGSGGVIQIHVPEPERAPGADGSARIRLPLALADSDDPLDALASPRPYQLISTLAARSRARSRWIPLGGADQGPQGTSLVRFLFGGIEKDGQQAGKILRDGDRVRPLPALLDLALTDADAVTILADGSTVELRGPALEALADGRTDAISNDLYLRAPDLLVDGAVRLALAGNPSSGVSFTIRSARLDAGPAGSGSEVLRLTTVPIGALTLRDQANSFGQTGDGRLELVPRFFRLISAGIEDALPLQTSVQIRFQAARENGIGLPDATQPVVDWTSDLDEFNRRSPGEIRYFRFEVDFDLDATSQGVGAGVVPVELDFLRVPFVF